MWPQIGPSLGHKGFPLSVLNATHNTSSVSIAWRGGGILTFGCPLCQCLVLISFSSASLLLVPVGFWLLPLAIVLTLIADACSPDLLKKSSFLPNMLPLCCSWESPIFACMWRWLLLFLLLGFGNCVWFWYFVIFLVCMDSRKCIIT